jgi:hypothetical protein
LTRWKPSEAVFALQHVLATDQAAIRVSRLDPLHRRADALDRFLAKIGGALGCLGVLFRREPAVAVADPLPVREGRAWRLFAIRITPPVRLPFGSQGRRRRGPGVARLGALVAGLDDLSVANVRADLLPARGRGVGGMALIRSGQFGRVVALNRSGRSRSGVGRVGVVPVERHRSSPPWQRCPIVIGYGAHGSLVQRHR